MGIGLALIAPKLFPDEQAEARRTAQSVVNALARARDEAIFSGVAVGVQLDNSKLSYVERSSADPRKWVQAGRANLEDMALPRNITSINFNSAEATEVEAAPRLVFLPAGLSTPLELTLNFGAIKHQISVNPIGNIALNAQPETGAK